jgi:uncharacterized membrane protein affecting hemolysin expression
METVLLLIAVVVLGWLLAIVAIVLLIFFVSLVAGIAMILRSVKRERQKQVDRLGRKGLIEQEQI